MRGIASASVVGIGLFLCSPASATTIPLVFQPPPVQTAVVNEYGGFDNFYTFTLSTAVTIRGIDTLIPVSGFSSYTDAMTELFSGVPTTGTSEGPAVAITGPTNSGSVQDSLGPGEYYFEVSADVISPSGVPVVNVLTVVTIPELPTWALLGLGFAALGYAGLHKRKLEDEKNSPEMISVPKETRIAHLASQVQPSRLHWNNHLRCVYCRRSVSRVARRINPDCMSQPPN